MFCCDRVLPVSAAAVLSCSAVWGQPGLEFQQRAQPFAADIAVISRFSALKLYLKQPDGVPFGKFSVLRQHLQQQCKTLNFAMNAGMFHPDFAPVGLYIENGKKLSRLQTATQGFGNFMLQPNGVLAWNAAEAAVVKTADYPHLQFKAQFATQSGPMLVYDGQINANFLPHSDSYKIRNGVGIKDQRLYFVISRSPVTFYQFASFFKHDLGIQQALYLDGSLSSADMPDLNRSDEFRRLGPIAAYTADTGCK